MKTTWLDEEMRMIDALRQTAELLVRGIRRPWLTLAFTLMLAAVIGLFLALGRSTYAPRLVLRLVEGDGAGHQTVVLRFESKEEARRVYESAAYQAVIGKRLDATSKHFAILIDGMPG